MIILKFPHRANFTFASEYDASSGRLKAGKSEFQASVNSYEGEIYHLRVQGDRWPQNQCLDPLEVPASSTGWSLERPEAFDFTLRSPEGKVILRTPPGLGFGVSGIRSMFQFEVDPSGKFFGMGEKNFGQTELSGRRSRFWNTDVAGDFPAAQWGEGCADPSYFTTPYVIVKTAHGFAGLLLHNPYPASIETPGVPESRVFVQWDQTSPYLTLSTDGGEPNLWILYGATLAELTRKLQKLVGVTPLPPAWALGYHQSRWGYGGHDDLMALDAEFSRHQIPCDALWMDLDYMDEFRIFQTSKTAFPDGAMVTVEALQKSNRQVVPILDPGVKRDPGYAVYDDGVRQEVFCKNPEGNDYVGIVWPGETVFPDFTMPAVREWWAGYVRKFAEEGFRATWCDMNDPSTGPVDPNDMLFQRGLEPHAAHHNQYALGMQKATRRGFLDARPNERPFMLSRSGFVGTSKYAAIWTGDNCSNEFYLRISIPTVIGMSLSGLPFCGPDLGGFFGDCSEGLMLKWMKCGFLFPFFRNHTNNGTKPQEPFAYSKNGMAVLRRYIRLRYKLFPSLYNLFIQQEVEGDPILRPLSYEFSDAKLDEIDDQFMIGSNILQAPFLTEEVKMRQVVLPGTQPWYLAGTDEWVKPGITFARKDPVSTPLYIRAGAILPMQPGTPTDNRKELREVHFHLFIPPGWTGKSEYTYHADDGISFDYRDGKRTTIKVELVCVEGNLAIGSTYLAEGFGPLTPTFVIHGQAKSVRLNGAAVTTQPGIVMLTGKPLPVQVC